MNETKLSVSDRNALRLFEEQDLVGAKIYFGDYIRLKGLRVGDIFYLHDEGLGSDAIIVIGNATPFTGVSTNDGGVGWDWDTYNYWKVDKVLRLYPEMNGSFLHPETVEKLWTL